VISAYTLAFGGLLLLGGRIGDVLGRRRAFLGGVLIFAFASLFGGLAPSGGWLLAMRALQGTGAAVTAPAVLALIATTFQGEKERNRAFGLFAGVSGAGAAIGLLAGGLLTEWLSWRWVLLPVSLSIIVVAAMMTKLMPKIGQRIPLITGPVLITGALAWLSTVAASTSYLTGLLGPMLLYGIGTGMIFMPLTMIGVSDVAVSDTGAASGLLNTTQQMGGALGLSILVTVFGAATSGLTGSKASVLATGASTGFLAAAGFAAVSFIVVVAMIKPSQASGAPVMSGRDIDSGPAPATGSQSATA
jgi:MFS family permease